ncbi:MAG: hypothetical protein AB9897_05920 [Anaerolineaceae bacterium]
MEEFIFPVEYKAEIHWDEFMIQEWIKSKKKYLTFAFNRFYPHTLPNHDFWLNLYFTKGSTDEQLYRGKIRYKFHVLKWSINQFDDKTSTYLLDSTLTAKVWFLCDHCKRVSLPNGTLLEIDCFEHPEGKNITSCLRNSIAPVICKVAVKETILI